jgi:hypothetical protein
MLPALPLTPAYAPTTGWPKGRRAAAWTCGVLFLIGIAPAAHAFEVVLRRLLDDAGVLKVDLRLNDVFDSRIEASLARGMPATLVLHAELWRRRTAWFDRLVSQADVSIKVRYEAVRDRYRIERQGLPPLRFDSIDSVRTVLLRTIPMPVGRINQLHEGARHYVMISATLQPLTVEDLREGEDWLSGEVEAGRSAGIGVLTSLPRSVFDALRDYAGLGDRRARFVSQDFRPEKLPVEIAEITESE